MSTDDTTIERGATFNALTHPSVEQFVVLDTDNISGYEAVRVAETDGETWHDYWSKAQYVADEANLGAAEPVGRADEAFLSTVEDAL